MKQQQTSFLLVIFYLQQLGSKYDHNFVTWVLFFAEEYIT
jgi:hypothetical protein